MLNGLSFIETGPTTGVETGQAMTTQSITVKTSTPGKKSRKGNTVIGICFEFFGGFCAGLEVIAQLK